MGQYVIQGGKRLQGELCVDGSKNAVLPIIAATILTGSTTILHNCPDITDVDIMLDILKELGCSVIKNHTTVIIDTADASSYSVSKELVEQMRSSIIFLGSILGRFHQAKISYPGGCSLGPRPINLHLDALKIMGIEFKEEDGFIISHTDRLEGATINLEFPSVGATENVMLAAVLAEGVTIINHAAREPEVIDLQNYLNSCGADVQGAGTDRIVIKGVRELHESEYTVMSDRIIAGTYLIAAAATGGNIRLYKANPKDIQPLIDALRCIGCYVKESEDSIILDAKNRLKGLQITTEPYPGFPTDLQPQLMAMLCVSNTPSVILEKIFQGRFNQVEGLKKMGADIQIKEDQAVIRAVDKLNGCEVDATDLRCGAALVIAGLMADGITYVNHIEYIKRGYHNIVEDLRTLGAIIEERK